jgi:hypothetical protein
LVKQKSLNDEALATLICAVEAIVNSRPLTVVSSDQKDMEPWTPNHLLFCSFSVVNLLFHLVYSAKMIYTQENDGDKFSTWQISFGNDGYASTCLGYKNDRSGATLEETLLLVM